MQQVVMDIMNAWGYLGVFLLIMLESVFPPIPSEVILIFGGALTVAALGGKLTIGGVILLATIGSIGGAIVLYFVGKILRAERLKKIMSGRMGRILRVKPSDIDRADQWFRDKGSIAVLVCRLVPILRSLISIPAGMSEMKMTKFILYTGIGSLIWNTVLVLIGHSLGSNWNSILGLFDNLQNIIIVICGLAFVICLVWWFGFHGKQKSKTRLDADKVNPSTDK